MSEDPSSSPSLPGSPPDAASTQETPSPSPTTPPAKSTSPSSTPSTPTTSITSIALNLIDPGPADDRRADLDPETLKSLANSISRQGVLQPIILMPAGERFITVAGRRRRDAARLAGLSHIPAILRTMSDQAAWETSTAENIFRSQLTPLEEAAACAAALTDGEMSMTAIALAMGRSERWVQDRLDMLHWPQSLLDAVHEGVLSVAAAAPLVNVQPEETRNALIFESIRFGATARTTSAWAQSARASHATGSPLPIKPGDPPHPTAPVIPHVNCWACDLSEPVSRVSYLPVCGTCITEIPAAMSAIRSDGLTAPAQSGSG